MSVVSDRIMTFADDDDLSPRHVNRLQDDAILAAAQSAGLGSILHYPHVNTGDNTLARVASADKVTISTGQKFSVAGVVFDTGAISNREIAVPDGFDGYVRVKLPAGFGEVVDEQANPIQRSLDPEFELVTGSESDSEGTGGGPSSPTNMRLYHIAKADPGDTPTVTAFANNGHSALLGALSFITGVVKLTSNEAMAASATTAIPWDAIHLETGLAAGETFWSAGNPTQLIAPAGYNFAQLGGTIRHVATYGTDAESILYVRQDGSIRIAEANLGKYSIVGTSVITPWIDLGGASAYFELMYEEPNGTSGVQLHPDSRFWIRVRK